MFAGIVEAIKALLLILAYFFNPRLRVKREKEQIWKQFNDLEAAYRQALAAGDPVQAAMLDKQMRELRAKHKFLSEGVNT
jgi:septation ring formation regulator EzrA